MASKVFTGARGRLMIGGVPVGYATNCSGGETIEYAEIEVMDDIRVKEHAPVRYRTRFSAGLVRLVGKTAKSRGLFPKTGNNSDEHLLNILNQENLTIAIEDVPTGKLIAVMQECKTSTNNWQVAAGSVSNVDVEFMCISQLDESEVG